jgi:hypothetical protein
VHRDTPLLIVVLNHERAVAHSRPLTPREHSFFQFASHTLTGPISTSHLAKVKFCPWDNYGLQILGE